MNRFVLILLLSLFNMVGAYAFTSNGQMPSYSMRSVNNAFSTSNTSRQENAIQYRVSNNTFSSTPSMQVNTIAKSSSKYSQGGLTEPGSTSPSDPRNIRGPQRAVGEGDEEEKEPETKDPFVPLGDALLPLLLLVAGYGSFVARKRRASSLKQ